MSTSPGNYPLSRSRVEYETDPYSPVIVDDLLNGINEWRNVQDIVRLTFKALSDVVKAQGATIRELERQMPTKASKAELNSGLAIKANISDVTRQVSDLMASYEGNIRIQEIRDLLEDKVSRNDLQYLLSYKVSVDEMRTALDSKANLRDVDAELKAIRVGIEHTESEILQRIHQCVTQRDLNQVYTLLDTKANAQEMNDALNSKANKQSVANALHRKANRSDMDALLARKVDINEFQNIVVALESKAELAAVEILAQDIDKKADRQEVNSCLNQLNLKFADKNDFDACISTVNGSRREIEHKLHEQYLELEGYIRSLKDQIEQFQNSFSAALHKKSDVRDLEKTLQNVNKKAEMDQLMQLKKEVEELSVTLTHDNKHRTKKIEDTMLDRSSRLENMLTKIEEELTRFKETFRYTNETQRSELEETIKYLQNFISSSKNEMTEDIKQFKVDLDKGLDDLRIRKADRAEVSDLKAAIIRELDEKASSKEIQDEINGLQRETLKLLQDLREENRGWVTRQERELTSHLDMKANLRDVQAMLTEKADVSSITRLMTNKASVEDFDALRVSVEEVRLDVKSKSDFREMDRLMKTVRSELDILSKDILQKVNARDICNLIDAKASIEDVNKALKEMHEELDLKASNEEFQTFVNDQSLINEAICAENCTARWIWKSGQLRSGGQIPWEIQSVNTCPDNFLWDRDKTSVVAVAPGLYEVISGFFCRKKPSIQLLVNGEAVILAGSSEGKQFTRHPAGNIAGLTSVDFVALPARARISILYTGESTVEGFLGLRKL